MNLKLKSIIPRLYNNIKKHMKESSLEKLIGQWKGGKPWNGKQYDKYGNVINEIMNGLIKE